MVGGLVHDFNNLLTGIIGSDVKIQDHLWWIEADKGQISQILHYLIFNAKQAMPA